MPVPGSFWNTCQDALGYIANIPSLFTYLHGMMFGFHPTVGMYQRNFCAPHHPRLAVDAIKEQQVCISSVPTKEPGAAISRSHLR